MNNDAQNPYQQPGNYPGQQPGQPGPPGQQPPHNYPQQPYPNQSYPGQQEGQPVQQPSHSYPQQPYPDQPYPGQPGHQPPRSYPPPQGHYPHPPYQMPQSRPSGKPPKNRSTAVYLSLALIALLIIGLVVGAVFLLKHLQADKETALTTGNTAVTTAPAVTTPVTTPAETAATTTVIETTPPTEEPTVEPTPEVTEAPTVEFPTDPYGYLLSQAEIDANPAVGLLEKGSSHAAQASLAYFTKREAFDLAFSYFSEIALKSEYNDTNDNLIHKWEIPIKVEVRGTPSEEDLATLNRIISELNSLKVVPTISIVNSGGNYLVYFVPLEEMGNVISGYVEDNWGFVSIYWDGNHKITDAEAAIAVDMMNQEERNHIILEEFVQGLGMLNDSYDYADSIFQQDWNVVQDLMPIDWAVIRILYHPDLYSGMSKDKAYRVLIREFFN
ncbi:MAG: DUF2927 domain-containing protein [Saccharofermentanales bacterium]|jgi:hypothetical protein|nr:DUF2927 domain-containing protein [Bacillota bacterium]NLB08957.1 DUF2927 domain-containing protein [Clostridiales bacterium]